MYNNIGGINVMKKLSAEQMNEILHLHDKGKINTKKLCEEIGLDYEKEQSRIRSEKLIDKNVRK